MVMGQAASPNIEIFPEKLHPGLSASYLRDIMGIQDSAGDRFVESLPFSFKDVTAGSENELQVVVIGKKADLDLAIAIKESNYFKNQIRRAARGDTSKKTLLELESYLTQKKDNVWENSWVRFPRRVLNPFADNVFRADLRSDKADPASAPRSDAGKFTFYKNSEEFLRVPVSYLLKLALADVVGSGAALHPLIRITGEKMLAHFSNDNTSPELFSFFPVRTLGLNTLGRELSQETLIRFLLTQALAAYAEEKFLLKEHGQQIRVFFSSSPPIMQKQLNDCIPDSFYRHLFMSPCLSGWNRGEEKHAYMKRCHKVLSRSQINGIKKLKEAGIINSNLVVLPNSSNISLANNGTHISLGSLKLDHLLKRPGSVFTRRHEKYIGDLAIKIVEHFLCLFPGTYSASPYRLDFEDFHPERVLGFLPHEIDYTHLRMIWRRWKRKARIHILGKTVTPFGPVWFDRLISRCFGFKGDYIPDFRLIDYFVSLMSTYQSPSLNGQMGNGDLLKEDLAQMGIFDVQMPLYQMVRLREHEIMGFSGFEHRYYSIFKDIRTDMGNAADLQNLLTLLAFSYILSNRVDHTMIPDTPGIESERRQIFFCSAIDLPTFFVKTRTRNRFLKRILARVPRTRHSRRYSGYTRIHLKDYKLALVGLIREDGAALIENLKLEQVITDLELRIHSPQHHATGPRLINEILNAEKTRNPMKLKGSYFNRLAERFYIEPLRKNQIQEAMDLLLEEISGWDLTGDHVDGLLGSIFKKDDAESFFDRISADFMENQTSADTMKRFIFLLIFYVHGKKKQHKGP